MSNYIYALLLGAAMGWLFVQWVDGCGEHYVDAKGNVHVVECEGLR